MRNQGFAKRQKSKKERLSFYFKPKNLFLAAEGRGLQLFTLVLALLFSFPLLAQTIRPVHVSQLRLTQLTTTQEGTMTLQDGDVWYNNDLGCIRKRIGGSSVCIAFSEIINPSNINNVRYINGDTFACTAAGFVAALADLPATGGTVDGRFCEGVNQAWLTNPFAGLAAAKCSTIILGDAIFTISAQILIPHCNQLIGSGRTGTSDTSGTEIKAISTFPVDTAMVRLGLGDDVLAFATRIENLALNCNDVVGCLGIYSNEIQEQSGARDVMVRKADTYGIHLEGTDPAGPGPASQPHQYEFINIEINGHNEDATNDLVGIFVEGTQGGTWTNITVNADNGTCAGGCTQTTGFYVQNESGGFGTGVEIINKLHVESFTDGLLVDGTLARVSVRGVEYGGNETSTNLVRLTNDASNTHFFSNIDTLGNANITNVLKNDIAVVARTVVRTATTQGIPFYIQSNTGLSGASKIQTWILDSNFNSLTSASATTFEILTTTAGAGAERPKLRMSSITSGVPSEGFEIWMTGDGAATEGSDPLEFKPIIAGVVQAAALSIYDTGSVVINQTGADVDFKIETSGNTNALKTDGGNDCVSIMTATCTGTALTVSGLTSSTNFEGILGASSPAAGTFTVTSTATNCSDGAGAAACGSAAAGSVVIDAGGTTSVVVSTTAVTANSQIFVMEDSSLGTKLSVTCNTTLGRFYAVTARTAATSFTITTDTTPTTNPACLSYWIVN